MASNVENRIVRMEFDNAKFEAKIKSTMASLAQLNKSLQLDGAKKGLTDLSSAAGKFNLRNLTNSLSGVGAGFLAMSTIAITALSRITSAALTAGANITKSLSVKPLMEGFGEYENNMRSIQTILANTKADGTNLRQVSAALDELNEYADKTIYNFGEMTRNIGTFTAAGVNLETSVQSIKGISNLAAISGSSAQQASTAMYQLSQAVSTGTLRLMDWNSVVNAGMGGEVFQKALFETGKALKTIEGVGLDTTFEEWTAGGNSFRDSLEQGWITSEVLTNTLKGFTGELTEAQLLAMGYSQDQAAEILELGQTGVEAATKIRTLTQLIDTMKEAVGTGWAETFKVVFGDFEEATELFTNIGDAVGGFISAQSEARNELLTIWADLGGRADLIDGLSNAFKALADIVTPIKDAFRDIFPKTTAGQLVRMTRSFADFTEKLIPSATTIENIKRTFSGFFAILDIGWETVKAGVGFIKDLVVEITGLGSGDILEFTASIGDFFVSLRDGLDQGGRIKEFFEDLAEALADPIDRVQNVRDAFLGMFANLGDIWEPLTNFVGEVGDILDTVVDKVGEWGTAVKEKLAETFNIGSFDDATSALNVGLLGGIALLLKKFVDGGLNLDFGGGIISAVTETLESITETLGAMQANLKSETLLKIATALAVLTASVVALSLIDDAALTRALSAMTVGFGQLLGAFAVLNRFDLAVWDGVKMAGVAAAMILLAGAIALLSISVVILSRLGWEELAKGLGAVTILMLALSASALIISKASGQMIAAGIGMTAMAIAINILALAVKQFAGMSWSEMAQGLAGVTGSLLILAGAMRLMPRGLVAQGAGLILVAVALNVLARAVSAFSGMEWSEMAKGFVGIGAGLLIIAGAMRLMPAHMLLQAAGLFVVALAVQKIAGAIQAFGGMSWGEIAKGLVTLAGALLILAVASKAIQSSIAGAVGIYIMAAAMDVLADVLIKLGEVSIAQLATSLGAIAVALLILGGAATLLAPVVGPMLALGAAVLLVGAGFALFGVAALNFAKAMEIMGEAGKSGADGLRKTIQAIGAALPDIFIGLAKGVVDFVKVLGSAAAEIAKAIGLILAALLEELKDILPLVGDVILVLIETLLEVIQEAYPQLIETGIGMILALLTGIKDNIKQVVTLALQIIVEFLRGIAQNIGSVIAAGVNLIVQFLNGIAQNIGKIYEAAGNLIAQFILAVAGLQQDIIDAGFDVLIGFLDGITNNLIEVVTAVGTMITKFITAVGNLATDIATAGTDALVDFLGGMTDNQAKIVTAVTTLITKFINSVSNSANRIVTAGANAIIDFVRGLGRNATRIVSAGTTAVIKFIQGLSANALRLARAAADVVIDFLNGLARVIREKTPELRAAGVNIATAIIDGITGGLASKAAGVIRSFTDTVSGGVDAVKDALLIFSPSKVFFDIGANTMEGFALGITKSARQVEDSAASVADRTVVAIRKHLTAVSDQLNEVADVNPTITPVLDLTKFREQANMMDGMIPGAPDISPSLSYNRAQAIAQSPNPNQVDVDDQDSGPGDLTFNQTINAPEPLSTSDIYKNTRNQIAMAKEELNVA